MFSSGPVGPQKIDRAGHSAALTRRRERGSPVRSEPDPVIARSTSLLCKQSGHCGVRRVVIFSRCGQHAPAPIHQPAYLAFFLVCRAFPSHDFGVVISNPAVLLVAVGGLEIDALDVTRSRPGKCDTPELGDADRKPDTFHPMCGFGVGPRARHGIPRHPLGRTVAAGVLDTVNHRLEVDTVPQPSRSKE